MLPRFKYRSIRWLLAELVVVVLGILIAFQIDEWGTQREERRQEVVGLQAISSDLEIGAEQFRQYRQRADTAYEQLVRVLQVLQDDQDLDADQIVQLTSPPVDRLWRPTATAFDSLRDTGNLNLISDKELRAALVSYFDIFEPYFLDIRLITSDQRQQYLDVLGKDFDLVPDPEFEVNQRVSRRLSVSPDDWPTDPDFLDVLIDFARDIHHARHLADTGLERVTSLQSRISAHIETIR